MIVKIKYNLNKKSSMFMVNCPLTRMNFFANLLETSKIIFDKLQPVAFPVNYRCTAHAFSCYRGAVLAVQKTTAVTARGAELIV
jgi:hypothetical protein